MIYYYLRLHRPITKTLVTVPLPFGMTREQAIDYAEQEYDGFIIAGFFEDDPDGGAGELAKV